MTSEKTVRSRLRSYALVAAVSTVIGVALSWWASTRMTSGGAWAVLVIGGGSVVLLLLGPKAVKR
jgi:hypothetical protein